MTIWILAILLIASVAGMGWCQGGIRAAFSFVGILFGLLLAAPVGGLFHWLLPHFGVSDPVYVWMLSPISGFILVSILFKAAAFKVHTQTDIYYRYKAGDLRLGMWQRLNARLGLCVGLLNGSLYFVAICFLIFNLTYWTVQAAPAWKPQSVFARLVNQMGRDLQSTGMARPAAALHSLPARYYQLADLGGFLMQNPETGARLSEYPGLTSLWQRDDMQALVNDGGLTNSLASDATLEDILNEPSVQDFLKNQALTKVVQDAVFPDPAGYADFTNYLATGVSAKYDGEKVLGRWDFNLNSTLAWLRQNQPNIQASELRAIRTLWTQAYAKTTILLTGDNQVFVQSWPHFNTQPGQPPELNNWKGDWSPDGANFTLHITYNGDEKFMEASEEDLRMSVKDGRNLLIFDQEN